MNKNNAKKFLPLVQAMAEGKDIEIMRQTNRTVVGCRWETTETISDGIPASRYRIKPEPRKPREWWINRYDHLDDCVHSSKEQANKKAASNRIECVLVREIIEE